MDKRKDLAMALAIAGLGLAIVVLSFDVPIGRVRDPIGTRTLPIVVGALLAAGGLALAARRLARWRREPTEIPAEGSPDEQPDRPASTWRALAMWGLCFGYVALLSSAGFLILTPLLIAAGLWLMGVRQPVRLAAVSLVPVALMFWLLAIVLNVRLPLGPLDPYLG
jgi:putative tricarboxylic transport membrane protein